MSKYTPADIAEITDVETVLNHYVAAQLWTGLYTDENEESEPLDTVAGVDDIPEEVMQKMRTDVEAFCKDARKILRRFAVRDTLTAEQLGHDFSLTRNGHGAGFWDRGWGKLGTALTEAVKPYGASTLMGWPGSESVEKVEGIDMELG